MPPRLAAPLPFLLLLVSACVDTTTAPEHDLSPQAAAYLEDALDIMRESSINRYVIDWPALRERTLARAGAARTPAEAHGALRFAIGQLGDRHSFLIPPGTAAGGSAAAVPAPPEGQLVDGRIAYLRMPPFSHPAAAPWAAAHHELIARLDAARPCGWIVDLRENSGGNMWPMLAGIGPVLGDGTPGAFVHPDGGVVEWYYRDGAAGMLLRGAETPVVAVGALTHRLSTPDPYVAVLVGPRTASAGEAVATAFRGRPRTRAFGQPTYGVSTANQGFELSDGATLVLTVARLADRSGRAYGDALPPDELVQGEPTGMPATDPAVRAAARWLGGQAGCA